MLIRIVNPNTTASMTEQMGVCAAAVAAAGTTIEAVTSPMGPASIESHYDEALAVPGLLQVVGAGGADGYVVGCFGDPGVDAARELASGPVIGIAEGAMRTAVLLGRTFSVVTTLGRTAGRAWELASRFGLADACRRVRACEIPVLELESPDAFRRITDECRRAVAEDEADVIVLGCAGMAELCARISASIGVPVVDGVAAATKMVESLVALGLRTSTRLEYAPPPAKAYTGLMEPFVLT
ncbi:aspartate/glutamate racemase family protein [Cryptosporangium phraense]|uniref:Aspartate/glutamate racemase family protein n=1 Tax=Cryptosporangium phraense TaxID=2593070 RepID=A0A545AN16_9ACTN|nr:aspartate/glutamate racemase family protein [Cryptosporangium phraense]TQS42660.1 aspartate/glutamate racemase family protein [Cryptosporangium phraense]